MFTSKLALPAVWLLLLSATSAAPAPEGVAAAVDTVATSTDAAPPVPTNEKGANAFVECTNTDGPFKPFCLPKHNDVYYPGSTHYVTWDTSFFPGGHNTSLKVLGFYTNLTTEPLPPSTHDEDDDNNSDELPAPPPPPEAAEEQEAFSSESLSAGWGFYQWHPTHALLQAVSLDLVNITLRLVALPSDGRAAQWYAGPTVTLRYKPKPPKKPAHTPTRADGQVLYVALPLVFGFAAFVIVGTFYWNRQLRRIGVGSVMGRASTRGRRLGASKRDRARNKDKESGIRLMESGGAAGAGGVGSDSDEEGWSHGSGSAGRRVFERVDRKRE